MLAVDGKANRALIEFLAASLKVSRSAIRIVAGEHSPRKVLEMDLEPQEAQRRLEALLPAE